MCSFEQTITEKVSHTLVFLVSVFQILFSCSKYLIFIVLLRLCFGLLLMNSIFFNPFHANISSSLIHSATCRDSNCTIEKLINNRPMFTLIRESPFGDEGGLGKTEKLKIPNPRPNDVQSGGQDSKFPVHEKFGRMGNPPKSAGWQADS